MELCPHGAALPKAAAGGFSMDRKNDGMGNLSVATREVTTENAPLPGFCETRKDAPGVLAVPPPCGEATKKTDFFRQIVGNFRSEGLNYRTTLYSSNLKREMVHHG